MSEEPGKSDSMRSRPKQPAPSELIELEKLTGHPQKKIRVDGKQTVPIHKPEDVAKELMNLIDHELPRVGKKEFNQPELIKMFQKLCPEMKIMTLYARRGSDRTLAPPPSLNKAVYSISKSLNAFEKHK